MIKKPRVLLPVFLGMFLSFPFSLWSQQTAPDYWVSRPYKDGLVIIGVSSRQLRGEGEIENARNDAAQKLLWYHGVKGTVHNVLADGPETLGLETSSKTVLEPSSAADFEALRETLKFDPVKDVLRTDSAVFVRFTCPATGAMPLKYDTALVNGAPQWIHRNVLELDGYVMGVGFSRAHRYLRETVTASREDAAAALVSSLSTHIEIREGISSDGETILYIEEIAEAQLTGFIVLEMWIDPKTKAVWTLAAARRGS